MITQGDQPGQATATTGWAVSDDGPAVQDARAGARPQPTASRPGPPAGQVADGDSSLSRRADNAVRRTAGAVFRRPGDWEIWDRRPRSPRGIIRAGAEGEWWDAPSGGQRLAARLYWRARAAWTACCGLAAVLPFTWPGWVLAIAALAAWLCLR